MATAPIASPASTEPSVPAVPLQPAPSQPANNPTAPASPAVPTTPAARTAPVASTIVQATEHIIVEGATAVITQVIKSTTADLKDIESNVAKEAVSATDENVPSLLNKVKDGLQDVAKEVVMGAEATVEAVEQHPELIAEGALAVAIGAASLIQPELVAGEVAIIGKMAADSAKKTITTIASDSGSKVVKAISKDLADDTKEEAVKDTAAATSKENADGKGAGNNAAKDPSDSKVAPVEPAKDAPNGIASSTADRKTPAVPDAPPKDTKAVSTEPAKEAANGRVTKHSDTKIESEKATAPEDRTIAIEVAQEPSKATSTEAGSSDTKLESSTAAPVSLKITLGADGEVKAVTKGDTEDKSKVSDVTTKSAQVISRKTSIETTTKTAVIPTKSRPNTADPLSESEQVPSEPSSIEKKTQMAVVLAEATKDKVQEVPAPVQQPLIISENKNEEAQGALKASSDNNEIAVCPPATLSAVAMVTSTTKNKTTSKPAVEDLVDTAESQMVAVSQESLDLLHQKIDILHEAIQQITKVLAFHTPTPPGTAVSHVIKSTEEEINEALASAVKPLTDLLPEILPNNGDTTHPPLEDPSSPKSSPKRPIPEKRTSMLGAIGKVFWPFGSSEKISTVTVAEVMADRPEIDA